MLMIGSHSLCMDPPVSTMPCSWYLRLIIPTDDFTTKPGSWQMAVPWWHHDSVQLPTSIKATAIFHHCEAAKHCLSYLSWSIAGHQPRVLVILDKWITMADHWQSLSPWSPRIHMMIPMVPSWPWLKVSTKDRCSALGFLFQRLTALPTSPNQLSPTI